MISRRCHCGCRAPLTRVRAHARYASRTCRRRASHERVAKASERVAQSQTRGIRRGTQLTAPHSYASTRKRAALLSLSGRERTLDKRQHFPSTALHENSLSVVFDLAFFDFSRFAMTEAEHLQLRIAGLEAELQRLQEAASIDLQNAHNDVVAKNRQIGKLKADLAAFRDEQPESGPTKEILLLWKTMLGKNGRTYIGMDGKRAGIVTAAIKKWGQQRCEDAIVGLSIMPWSGPQGRAVQSYPGAERYDDIEHALGDEVRMEKLVAVAKRYERPSLLDPPIGPQPVPTVKAEVKAVPVKRHTPSTRGSIPWVERPPISKVLDALHDFGCQVVGYDNKPDSWSAQCPAHEDRSPSLSITRKSDGMVLVKCWAACDTGDVLAALHLTFSDLWENCERDFNRLDGPPAKKVIPAHLRHAMAQLMETNA